MSNVVQFKRSRARQQWQCNCGCVTFYAYDTGELVCPMCQTVQSFTASVLRPPSDDEEEPQQSDAEGRGE